MRKKKSQINSNNVALIGVAIATLIAAAAASTGRKVESDPKSTSVMVLASSGRSGGSGVILKSTSSRSEILTNKHVCEVVKAGGIIRSEMGDFQVTDFVTSRASDLCLIGVSADLHAETELADEAAGLFESAKIVGHPTLLPTVSTEGHFAGRKTIEVMTGIRPCTKKESRGPFAIPCFILGGMPIVGRFESNIVTATIMAGSSGSGVFNSNNQLVGLVFAGMGGLSYAFTVPLEQMKNFLATEVKKAKTQYPKQEFSLQEILMQDGIRRGRSACVGSTGPAETVCSAIEKSLLWTE